MEIILSALKDKEHYQVVEGNGALNCFSSNHNDATHVLFGTMKHFVGLIAARIFGGTRTFNTIHMPINIPWNEYAVIRSLHRECFIIVTKIQVEKYF